MRVSGTKPDATGRSSGKVAGRLGKIVGPPKDGEPWVWHRRELLISDAWKARSITCIRFLTALEIDYMNHAGTENGNLKATYDQLEEYGASRRLLPHAVEEAEFLGLVRAERGGRWAMTNQPSTYRLTYLPDRWGNPASNQWRNATTEKIAAWKQERKKMQDVQRVRKEKRKKQKAGAPSYTTVVPLRKLPTAKMGGGQK